MKALQLLYIALLLFVIGSCKVNSPEPKAKYVFLFIGDGMGMNQVYSAELYMAAINNQPGNADLNMTKFPIQSYVTTFSASSLITCSSAAATAIATGNKTNNGVLNKNPELTVNYETIAEKAKKAGYKIGILTSVPIDHATPAGFYAHSISRNFAYDISMEMPESGFDYFAGGGFSSPRGKDNNMPDAVENLKAKGYTYVNTLDGFKAIKNGDDKVFAVNPKLYPKGEFFWDIDKVEGSISLSDFTKKGIEVLDNEKGFFMMVEGGKIDWAAHSNDLASCVQEVLAFDEAIANAVDFYKAHPDETLIIVTADHETGGLGLGINKTLQFGLLQYQKISAQEFGRVILNFKLEKPKASFDEVMSVIEKYFGLGNGYKGLELTSEEKNFLYEGYELEFVKKELSNPDDEYLEESENLLIADRVIKLMSQKVGVGWISNNHSGTPVPIRAMGQGQENFASYIDNTDISKIIGKLMGIE